MKIYTRTGDTGETSLFGGQRVSKAELRIDTYGTIDELNAWMGMLRDQPVNKGRLELLLFIQDRLFTIGSRLATLDVSAVATLPALDEKDVVRLEMEIDRMDKVLPQMRSFVLPGGHPTVSTGHVARTVCRRAERLVVALHTREPVESVILVFLNRLSDYLFILCRSMAHELRVVEAPWKPRRDDTPA